MTSCATAARVLQAQRVGSQSKLENHRITRRLPGRIGLR